MKKREINILTNRWLEAGAISSEQATYINNDVDKYISETSGGKFITLVMYIGALALSSGVLLVISANWSGMSSGLKLILALLLPVIPLIFAYWHLIVKESLTVLPRVANIFGVVLVGGSIAIIEQTYHLQSSISGTLWMWTLLTIPFVFVYKRVENVAFSTILTAGAMTFSLFTIIDRSNIEDSTALLLLTIFALGVATVMYFIGGGLRESITWLDSGRFLRIGAATTAVITLFFTTFEFYARVLVNEDSYSYYYGHQESFTWMPISITLNLIFIGFLVFALFRAVKFEEYNFAFWVVRVAAIYLLVKYYTLFSTMLDTGLFFILGGIIFILGARNLEKNKTKLIEYLRKSYNNQQNPSTPHNTYNTYGE